jgi:hypothetical protein
VGSKNRPVAVGRFSYFFQVCFFLSVTILTSPTTGVLSFVRRRTIIRLMTISKIVVKFISGFLSYRVPQTAVTKKPPVVGRLVLLYQVWLLHSHLGHPNRKVVLKNKDRNNNDKDEA